MNLPKVSIIVPIYGTEKYLRQCVDSILAQTLKDIEIILIDDGSTDNCPQIVDEYATKDSRVVPVHQPNSGYGRAVNHGLELATAPYVGIIESDDWAEPAMYEMLYNNINKNNADVVKCSFYVYNSLAKENKDENHLWEEHKKELFSAPEDVFTLHDYPMIIMSHASIWAMLYNRNFLNENNIKFLETKHAAYQDFPFMASVFSKARRICVVKEPLVHWRRDENNENSTSQKGERLLQMLKMSEAAITVLKEAGVLDLCKEEIYFHCLRANQTFFRNIMWKFKGEYFDGLYHLFQPLKKEYCISFKYFNPDERDFVMCVLNNDLPRAISYVYRFNPPRESLGVNGIMRVFKKLVKYALPYFLVRLYQNYKYHYHGKQALRKQ